MRVIPFAVSVVLLAAEAPAFGQESLLDGLQAAAKANPGDSAAALALGRALRRAGRWGPALSELHRGMSLVAGSDLRRQLRWEAARVEFDRRDFARATAACAALNPASADGHACMADADLVRQRATEALDETAAALAKDPQLYEAKVAEGRSYELELDAPKAEASLRSATAARPDEADAHLALGLVLSGEGKNDEALAELRRAVQIDPSGPDALVALGLALAPGAESMHLLERAAHERPSLTRAWLALGAQQLAQGQAAQAGESADAALRASPTDAAARVLAGKVALSQGRLDDALRAGEAALKIVANSAAAKLLVADASAKKGEIDAALEAYQAAWGFDHADPTPLVHASEACRAADRNTSARAFGARATQDFPKWAPGWVALGDALVAQGEKQSARDAYRSALAAPDGPIDKSGVERKLSALR